MSPASAWMTPPSAALSSSVQASAFLAKRRIPSIDRGSSLSSNTATGQENRSQSQQEQAEQPAALRGLYPPSVAHSNGTLQVDELHTLYYEVHGNQSSSSSNKKKSALFLHGGPGAGCNANHARFFDPNLYDTIVLVDQRGCGKSTPRGQVYHNSLKHLVGDCERLREHLQVGESWDVVLGGSWGSTLAVAYAQEFPQRVKSVILRGVCLLRSAEVDWLFTPQGGAAQQNPKGWDQFSKTVGMATVDRDTSASADTDMESPPLSDRSVLHAYYDRFFSRNATERWTAARGWMTWEFTASSSYKEKLKAIQNATHQADKSINEADEIPQSPAILVSSSSSDQWSYEDSTGATLSPFQVENMSSTTPLVDEDPAHYARGALLRQGLLHPQTPSTSSTSSQPRLIALQANDFEDPKLLEEKVGNFSGFPAMPMLTCFYSVNDRFAMNDIDLIAPERMKRLQDIPCIAIQGGMDPICPPDTALDVKELWPGMELRIPVYAGHSMYHPELAHELVQATDRMAALQ